MVSGMPFKHNAACHHRAPKTHYRVRSWPDYETGLKRRARSLPVQQSETAIGVDVLNRMIWIVKPASVRLA